MRVTIDKSIIDQYDTVQVPLDCFRKFLIIMEYKGYVLDTDSAISFDEIVSKLNYNDQKLFEGIITRSVNHIERHSSDCIVVVGGETECIQKHFSIYEIEEYLGTAATVIVENGMNDGLFVRAIMKHFATEIDFEKQLSNSLVAIDPASGSGARSRIEYFLNIHHDQPKYLRCLVIVDGDKRFPEDNTYGGYQTQQNDGAYFQSKNVTYHVLEKRAMENYMPDEVYDSHRNVFGNNWVDAYLRLTEEQKNYYYIASGFLKDIPKTMRNDESKKRDRTQSLSAEIQTVFSTITDDDYLTLLTNPYIGGNFKDEFPKHYNDSQVTKQSLLRRSPVRPNGKSELEEIAEEIIQLL